MDKKTLENWLRMGKGVVLIRGRWIVKVKLMPSSPSKPGTRLVCNPWSVCSRTVGRQFGYDRLTIWKKFLWPDLTLLKQYSLSKQCGKSPLAAFHAILFDSHISCRSFGGNDLRPDLRPAGWCDLAVTTHHQNRGRISPPFDGLRTIDTPPGVAAALQTATPPRRSLCHTQVKSSNCSTTNCTDYTWTYLPTGRVGGAVSSTGVRKMQFFCPLKQDLGNFFL